MDALILESDDWEGLFIDGCLVDEGQCMDLLRAKHKYNLCPNDFRYMWITKEDNKRLMERGFKFPNQLSDLKGDYR